MQEQVNTPDVERLTRERDLYRTLAYDYAWAIWCTAMDCDPSWCSREECLPGLPCRPCVETMIRGHCIVDSDARNEMMPPGYYQRIYDTLQALRELEGIHQTPAWQDGILDLSTLHDVYMQATPGVWECSVDDEMDDAPTEGAREDHDHGE